MAKYSLDFKLKVVEAYLFGTILFHHWMNCNK